MRYYSSTAVEMALTGSVNEIVTTLVVDTVLGLPAQTPFTLAVDIGLSTEEIVTVTSVSGMNLTVTRGADGTSAVAHTIGALTRHMVTARDLREPQEHLTATANVHGIGATASVVGTDTAQTLTNKTVNFANNTVIGVPQASVTDLVSDLDNLLSDIASLAGADAGLVNDIAALVLADAGLVDDVAVIVAAGGGGGPTAYTPTLTGMAVGTGGTPVNTAIYAYSNGVLVAEGKIKFGTTGVAFPAVAIAVSLPPGFEMVTVDTNADMPSSVAFADVSLPATYKGLARYQTATSVRLVVLGVSGTNLASQGTGATAPFAWQNDDEIYYRFTTLVNRV